MQQTQTYRQRSRNFLVKAMEELNAGDLEQASGKGWAAAALIVKAVAEERSLDHRSHKSLYDIVDDLVSETGYSDLNRLFHLASSLHINFYENYFRTRSVQDRLDDVERFVNKVEPLLTPSA